MRVIQKTRHHSFLFCEFRSEADQRKNKETTTSQKSKIEETIKTERGLSEAKEEGMVPRAGIEPARPCKGSPGF